MRDRSSLSNCSPPSCGESSVSTAWTAPRCSPAQRFAYPVEAGFEEHFLQLGGYQAGHEAGKVIVNHGGQASLGAERKKNSSRRAFTPRTSFPHSASRQRWQKRSRYEGGFEPCPEQGKSWETPGGRLAGCWIPPTPFFLTLNSVICCSRWTMNCWTQGSLASYSLNSSCQWDTRRAVCLGDLP